MRSFLYKLYFLLTGPLYRRLHLELSLQMQEVVRANVEHNENTTKKILDEVLRLSYLINGGPAQAIGPDETRSMSDAEIAAIIKDVESSMGLVEVCKKHDLPLNTVFLLRTRFSGMTEPAIRRTREIEQRCTELTATIESLTTENKRLLTVSTPLPPATTASTSLQKTS